MFPHFKSWLRLTLALAFAPSLAGSLPLAVAQTTALPIPEDLRKVCNLLTRRKSEKGELLVFVIESNIKPCEQALAHYRQSKNRDRSVERQILWDLAKTYRWLGRDSQAIHYYQQSIAITRTLPDPKTEFAILTELQQVYVRQRNYDQAIESLQRAFKLTRELPDRHLEMRTWGSLGIVYLDQGQREKAIASYQQALAIAQELGDRRAEGQASEGIGLCYLSLGPSDASLRADPD